MAMKKSKIKWQTGMPEQSDVYLVTTTAGEVTVNVLYATETSSPFWLNGQEDDEEVVAWCKLSDIEPYKE